METSVSLLDRLATQPTNADWQRLHDLYAPLLRAWLGRADVPTHDADDLVQDVLLVLHGMVGQFERRGPGAFRNWLRTIVLNRVRNYWRKMRAHPPATGGSDFYSQLAALEDAHSGLSALWEREHDEYLAARALAQVRMDVAASTWTAFQLYVLEGHPPATVAAQLGVGTQAVFLAKSRILKRMRTILQGLVET